MCPSVRIVQLTSHWKDFHVTWYLSILRKSVGNIQASLTSDKNNRYCIWRPIYIVYLNLSRWILLRMKNVSSRICRWNQNIHFVFSNFLFRKSFRLLANVVEYLAPDRLQMTIWHMRIACWIHKATNTHLQYVIIMLLHYHNGCTNAPQCYVVHTVPVLSLLLKVLRSVAASPVIPSSFVCV